MRKYTQMEIKAARALNRQMAEECGIDEQDQWKIHSEEMKAIARTTLEACGANAVLQALIEHQELTLPIGKTMDAIAKATTP
jgi:hypothetical protein